MVSKVRLSLGFADALHSKTQPGLRQEWYQDGPAGRALNRHLLGSPYEPGSKLLIRGRHGDYIGSLLKGY